MATYVIGDIQGCFEFLQQLLAKIQFDPQKDTLWFTGDLVNRGQQSLETLRFVKSLSKSTVCVLGNHDLALLAADAKVITPKPQDTFQQVLAAPDKEELLDWLRQRPVLHHDPSLGFTLTHAGIFPLWDLKHAIRLAHELETLLRGPQFPTFIQHMFGNAPHAWHEDLKGWDRYRFLINAFTRMRYVHANGELDLTAKGSPDSENELIPWFEFPGRLTKDNKIIFGHWAALEGKCTVPNVFALDTGCVWGHCLTALCLESNQRFTLDCSRGKVRQAKKTMN